MSISLARSRVFSVALSSLSCKMAVPELTMGGDEIWKSKKRLAGCVDSGTRASRKVNSRRHARKGPRKEKHVFDSIR